MQAPAVEIFKWFLISAKQCQRAEDERALREYEHEAEQYNPCRKN
jgi:hypothetical protein